MQKKLCGLVGMLIFLCVQSTGFACTLWGAVGDEVDGGGTLIAKNRDERPDHQQILQLVTPIQGYRYFGIFPTAGGVPGVKMGLNEKGLVVMNAAVGTIPNAVKAELAGDHVLSRVLEGAANVDEALVLLEKFHSVQTVVVADNKKIAYIEYGVDSKAVRVIENGNMRHTNHFIEESMIDQNEKEYKSSSIRLARIGALLESAEKPLTLESFIAMSEDHVAGPSNSIYRTGRTIGSVRTMSDLIVYLPPKGSIKVYVKLLNPGETEKVYRLTSEQIFAGGWEQAVEKQKGQSEHGTRKIPPL